jgi:hypothetical protein
MELLACFGNQSPELAIASSLSLPGRTGTIVILSWPSRKVFSSVLFNTLWLFTHNFFVSRLSS